MWADAQRNGRPRNISGALSESCVGLIPFFVPRHKVWLTAAAQVPCTNDANLKRKTWTQSEFCTSQNSDWGQEPPKMCIICTYLHMCVCVYQPRRRTVALVAPRAAVKNIFI